MFQSPVSTIVESRTCLSSGQLRAGPSSKAARRILPSIREHVSLHQVTVLHAPIELSFAYTRSLGATLGAFMTGLADGQFVGARGSDGRVHVPPPEYDPLTAEALTE